MLFFKQCPVSYNTPYEKIGDEVRSLADEIPFDIPDSWEWVTLQTIATSSLGKTLDKAKNKGDLKPYLCSINVYWDGIDLTTVKETRLKENELPKYLLRPGDLLICEGGDVGRSAVWESTQEMYYQNALHRVRFYGEINPHYFQLLLECYKGNQILDAYSKGMTIKHLVQTALNTIVFPLPPLSEQTRIVDAVNRLLPYLHSYDRAEQKLSALNTGFPEALKKSILQEAVQGKLVPQDPSDEPAEALLGRIRAESSGSSRKAKSKRTSTNPSFSDGIILIMRSWTVWSAVSTMNYPLRSRNRGRGCDGGQSQNLFNTGIMHRPNRKDASEWFA